MLLDPAWLRANPESSSWVPRSSLASGRGAGTVFVVAFFISILFCFLTGVDYTQTFIICFSNWCGLCLGLWSLLKFWAEATYWPVWVVMTGIIYTSVMEACRVWGQSSSSWARDELEWCWLEEESQGTEFMEGNNSAGRRFTYPFWLLWLRLACGIFLPLEERLRRWTREHLGEYRIVG